MDHHAVRWQAALQIHRWFLTAVKPVQFKGHLLPVHLVERQAWYSLGFNTPAGSGSQGSMLPGHFVVDISETLEIKLKAIRAYRSQFPPEKERIFRLVEGQNRLYGAGAGFAAGER